MRALLLGTIYAHLDGAARMSVLWKILTLCLLLIVASGQFCHYKGHQLLKIVPRTRSQLHYLKREFKDKFMLREYQVWVEPFMIGLPMLLMTKRDYAQYLTHKLRARRIMYNVQIDDLANVLDDQSPAHLAEATRVKFQRHMPPEQFNTNIYHTMDEITALYNSLTRTYPSFVSQFDIGISGEGRKLTVLQIGSDPDGTKPAVFLECGIHGREWAAIAGCVNFVVQVITTKMNNASTSHQSSIFNDTQTIDLETYVLFIIPMANPDAYLYTWTNDRFWRKSRTPLPECQAYCSLTENGGWRKDRTTPVQCQGCCAGVDLNRNWNTTGADDPLLRAASETCSELYAGGRPFSEPETRALSAFVLAQQGRLRAYVAIHGHFTKLLFPFTLGTASAPSWRNQSDERQRWNKLGRSMQLAILKSSGILYEYGSAGDFLPHQAGTSVDWVYEHTSVDYALTVELRWSRHLTDGLGGVGAPIFCLPVSELPATVDELLASLTALFRHVQSEEQSRRRDGAI